MDRSIQHIGILGGTFNPPHRAHLEMAAGVQRAFTLDKLLFVPTNEPPHKQVGDHIPAALRYEMTRLAIEGYPKLALSDIELMRKGKSYTVDTLRALHKQYPDAQFSLIVGGDMLKDLPNWKDAEKLWQLASIIGVNRTDGDTSDITAVLQTLAHLGASVIIADFEVPPISSTHIRQCVHDAQPVTSFVPSSVEWFIYEHALYMGKHFQHMQEKCRCMLNTKRYQHTVGVMLMAVALASAHGADTRQARLAALLHDYGRSIDDGALTHAQTGERLARETFHIQNLEVLGAIRYHTTLRAGASKLEKILYLADMIAYGRAYPAVEELRRMAFKNLDHAVVAGLQNTIAYVRERGSSVHSDSIAALHEFMHTCN